MKITPKIHLSIETIFNALDTPKVFRELHKEGIAQSALSTYLPLMCKLKYIVREKTSGYPKKFLYTRVVDSIPSIQKELVDTENLPTKVISSIEPRLVSFASANMRKKLHDLDKLNRKNRARKINHLAGTFNMV